MALFSSIHRFHSNIYWIMGHGSDFNNTNAIPGLIFIGALTVPLSGLFFFMNQMRLKILAF